MLLISSFGAFITRVIGLAICQCRNNIFLSSTISMDYGLQNRLFYWWLIIHLRIWNIKKFVYLCNLLLLKSFAWVVLEWLREEGESPSGKITTLEDDKRTETSPGTTEGFWQKSSKVWQESLQEEYQVVGRISHSALCVLLFVCFLNTCQPFFYFTLPAFIGSEPVWRTK